MKWTPKQQEVINARGCNLLVSAAAGSGKTAVLVERIIHLICDEENPIDIDRLLVMTFTSAAAGEMRERILKAIEEKLAKDPAQEHLQVQAALVHRAQITTIDSFCLSLIRDHFNLLDIDPAFRIGDEGELMLLRGDVMEDMLEEYYEKDDPVFSQFVENYASGKSDSGIEDYIMQVYTFSQSNPFPREWLDQCRQELLEMNEEELDGTPWMRFLLEDVRRQAEEWAEQLTDAMEVCGQEGGPHMYLPTLQTELELVRKIGAAKDYGALYEALQNAEFGRMAAARGKTIDPEKKEYAAAARDRVKKAVKAMVQQYGQSPADAVDELAGSRDVVLKLLELAGEFHRRYQEAKRDKNIVDFNDLEHEALRVLVKREDKKLSYTPVADELSKRYAQILVDEYQDSNDVQETLIKSLSAERFGRPNVFMVGDVKQSIYKFRLARPELFMKKYECYEDYGAGKDNGPEGGMEGAEAVGEEKSGMSGAAAVGGEDAAAAKGRKAETGMDDAGAPGEEKAEVSGEGKILAEALPAEKDPAMNRDRTEAEEESVRGKKIELRQNFRSRASVLDSINEVFFQIMTRNLGNIQYTDKVALHAGASFARTENLVGTPTELLLVDTGSKALGPNNEELEDYTSREIEARLIASRIRELTDPKTGLSVWDKEAGCYRLARYGDMVILLRSLTGWTDSFLNVLTQEDIPAFAETGTGYFDTIEVETVLAMLAVIDNPIQDIPLAAVLKSPMVGMEEEELAWLMAVWKHAPEKGQDRGIYGALRLALLGREQESAQTAQETAANMWDEDRQGPDGDQDKREKEEKWESFRSMIKKTDAMWEDSHIDWEKSEKEWKELAGLVGMPEDAARSIHKKSRAFASLLSALQSQAAYVPIHELIHRVYLQTGYYDYVSAMPAGEVRKANLDMLIEKASAYEKTSYKGLFHFIRYIERLKKYDTDFGEATAAGKSQEMVRVMSIHKSKGLEFPIVFLAGMGKVFNKQDIRGKLLIDADLGIGADHLNVDTRVRACTLKKNVLKRKMDLDGLGEELRVLYVAMTRAKEKLIMTGADRYLDKKLERWHQKTWTGRQIPYTILATASSYLDWILMCQPDISPLFSVEMIPVESLVGQAVARRIEREVSEDELRSLNLDISYDEGMERLLTERLSFRYPYEADIDLHTKISVSQLKKQGQDIDDKNSLFQPVIPEFLKEEGEKKEPGGAVRGSAYHRVLELIDLPAMTKEEDVRQWIRQACGEGRIAEDAANMVKAEKIWRFLQSPMGKRMRLAQKEGRLHREQQFVMGIPARDMGLGKSPELVLIQGIIDAWMEDDDGLVLVDYKTDRIGKGQEELLVKRYQVQLDYYKRALEQMVKRPVKEMVIYSLTLQKEIFV